MTVVPPGTRDDAMGAGAKLNPEDAGAGEDPSEGMTPMFVPKEKAGCLFSVVCDSTADAKPPPELAAKLVPN